MFIENLFRFDILVVAWVAMFFPLAPSSRSLDGTMFIIVVGLLLQHVVSVLAEAGGRPSSQVQVVVRMFASSVPEHDDGGVLRYATRRASAGRQGKGMKVFRSSVI